MNFDSTAIAIIIGLIGASSFTAIELYRRKELEIMNGVVVFLALYAVFAGHELLTAALEGDPNNLPKSWREYLGVAGVVIIGLSLQHILKTFSKIIKISNRTNIVNRDHIR